MAAYKTANKSRYFLQEIFLYIYIYIDMDQNYQSVKSLKTKHFELLLLNMMKRENL
jgi:hypothetical protein